MIKAKALHFQSKAKYFLQKINYYETLISNTNQHKTVIQNLLQEILYRRYKANIKLNW